MGDLRGQKTAISYKAMGGCPYFREIRAGTLTGTRLAVAEEAVTGTCPQGRLVGLAESRKKPGTSRIVETSLGTAQKGE